MRHVINFSSFIYPFLQSFFGYFLCNFYVNKLSELCLVHFFPLRIFLQLSFRSLHNSHNCWFVIFHFKSVNIPWQFGPPIWAWIFFCSFFIIKEIFSKLYIFSFIFKTHLTISNQTSATSTASTLNFAVDAYIVLQK